MIQIYNGRVTRSPQYQQKSLSLKLKIISSAWLVEYMLKWIILGLRETVLFLPLNIREVSVLTYVFAKPDSDTGSRKMLL